MTDRRNHRYQNAKFILPDDLYQQIIPFLEGKLVWFPSNRELSNADRNAYIHQLRNDGMTVAEIADQVALSDRHVWRILADEEAASLPSRSDSATNQ